MKFQIRIDGRTPLLQASTAAMLLTSGPKMKSVEDVPPVEQAALLVYKTKDGDFGHPTVAFWSAFVEAAKQFKLPTSKRQSASKLLAGALTIEPFELVPLVDKQGTPLPEYRVDVRVIRNKSTGGRRPVGKPRWDDWHCLLDVELDDRVWPTTEEAEKLFFEICDYAGRAIGIGAGRPENRKLQFGKFNVTKIG